MQGTGVFVTSAGAEVSVRTVRDTITGLTALEPMYASDIEVLDGATGELWAHGADALRGTLRRIGNMFLIHSGAPGAVGRPESAGFSPPSKPAPLPWARKPKPRRTGSRVAEAIEAAETLARYVRGDPGVLLTTAQHAHEVIGRFLAKQK